MRLVLRSVKYVDKKCVVSAHSASSVAVICEISAVVRAGRGAFYLYMGILHSADLSAAVLQIHLKLRH